MAQSFDDFAGHHAKEQQDRERLAKETKPEWEILKGLVSQFALDNKGIGSYRFQWTTSLTGRPLLTLNNVAVMLYDHGDRNGVPQDCHARFSRRPAGSGQVYIDDSPLAEETWTLQPGIKGDEFVWLISELEGRFSSAALSEEIAKHLASYHIQYEKAYGRAV